VSWGRTSCWRGKNGFYHRRGRESEGGESRDESMVMVRLMV
jgi:hypothetical protein